MIPAALRPQQLARNRHRDGEDTFRSSKDRGTRKPMICAPATGSQACQK